MKNWSIVCKAYPASPLIPVHDGEGLQLTFETESEAQEHRDRFIKSFSGSMPGGGPYYFVVKTSD